MSNHDQQPDQKNGIQAPSFRTASLAVPATRCYSQRVASGQGVVSSARGPTRRRPVDPRIPSLQGGEYVSRGQSQTSPQGGLNTGISPCHSMRREGIGLRPRSQALRPNHLKIHPTRVLWGERGDGTGWQGAVQGRPPSARGTLDVLARLTHEPQRSALERGCLLPMRGKRAIFVVR